MGLDITAVRNAKLIGKAEDYDDWEDRFDWSNTRFMGEYFFKDFPDQARGVTQNGVYQYSSDDVISFRAGSYSGYNAWRNELSHLMLRVSARTVWNNADKYKDKPFYYLIHFSDCEGVIGPEIAKVLAKDFSDYQALVDAHYDDRDYFRLKYAEWRQAFEFAAQNGFVEFH